MKDVYLGIGGNADHTEQVMRLVLKSIAEIDGVYDVVVSSFYDTTPVSDIVQPDYINAVCKLTTSMQAHALQKHLQSIEVSFGKTPKPKNAPRIIDIDILFFGTEKHEEPDLQIPHPRWHERLFVLVPLLELTKSITLPNLEQVNLNLSVETFTNPNHEKVICRKSP